jgi:hypothetical protein
MSGQTGAVTKDDWMGAKYETPESQASVGLSPSEARAAAIRAGVSMIRDIDGHHDVITFDYRPYRLNLLVIADEASRAAFF